MKKCRGKFLGSIKIGDLLNRNEKLKERSAYRVGLMAIVVASSVLYKYHQVIGKKT
jgi:hypothetical protein